MEQMSSVSFVPCVLAKIALKKSDLSQLKSLQLLQGQSLLQMMKLTVTLKTLL
jgi:hypothetical protein